MAFSFSNWFKKPSGQEDTPSTATIPAEAPAAAPATRFPSAPPTPAPSDQPPRRTLKTVVPNSVRPVNLREGMARPGGNPIAPPSAGSLRSGPSAVPPGTRSIVFPSSMVPVAPAVSIAPVAPPAAPTKAVAATPPAFHAAPDASVVIPLGEFFDRIPTNLLQAGADVDRAREVVFRATDLYNDLARGRASLPVSAVQAACPDLFGRPVSATEDVEITLPLQRVIEQLAGAFQTRPDQVAEDDVAEVETPFLQVALEDSVRLPKPPAPVTPPPVAARPPAPAAPVPAEVPPPARIAGNEASTIRALTPRQSPATPHAPAHAPAPVLPADSASLVQPRRDAAPPINPAAKRPPATVRASVAGGKIRLSGPAISSRSIAPAAANSTPTPLAPSAPPAAAPKPVVTPAASTALTAPPQKKTARIQIPPIALRPAGPAPGAPAAASRPPAAPAARAVPFPEPVVSFRATPGDPPHGAAPAPASMPPPLAMPSSAVTRPLPHANISLRPAGGPPPTYLTAPPPMMPFAPVAASAPVAPAAPTQAPAAVEEDGSTIGFTIAPILRTLPEGMFTAGLDGYGAAEQVPDGARVELPQGFITAQLAQGRVAVPRAMFVAAMPAACRHLMLVEGEPAEVIIPLQEVFQNLPTGALSRRSDQVVDEVGPEIPTPFSQKAQEDAQRLAPAADPEPAEETVPPEPEPEALAVPVEPESPAVVEPEPEPVTAEASTSVTVTAEPSEPESAAEVPTPEPEPEPVAEVPAVEEEEKESAPEPVTARAEEPLPVEAVAEPEPEAAAPTMPEPTEETPAAAEAAAPADVEAIEPLEVSAVPLPTEEPPVEPPVAELAPTPEIPTVAAVPEVPLPVQDLAPTPEVRDPERLPMPMSPGPNGQPAHVPMAALSPVPAASPEEIQDTLRAIFMVDEELDAKKIVRHAASLPGLKACAVMFGDGLKLAGDLADGLSVSEGFCAMTPPFFRRARAYAAELDLGETQCVSLQTERALLSFFMAGNVCLSVQHVANRPFLPGVREKLLAATMAMARMYATPTAH